MDNLSYYVILDGEAVNDIDPAIHIVNVEELAPSRTLQTTPAGMLGSHLLRDQCSSLAVRVQLAILTDDLPRRKAVCSRIAQWAKGGKYLTLSDRPGQRLSVRCTALPTITSAREWGKALTMVFTAYEAPWWEDVYPTQVSCAQPAATQQLSLRIGGTQDSQLDARITARADVSSITITVNNGSMTFAALGLSSGEQLLITHEDGLLLARTIASNAQTPCLNRRTADSCDDLLVAPQCSNDITIQADGAVTAICEARGRYD